MAWSNIFLQLITGAGPVIGEGLLQGWELAIELEKFSWRCQYEQSHEKSSGSLGGSIASAAKSALGLSGKNIKMEALEITKRFDIASSQIHFCVDRDLPVVSALITVLNIKQGGRAIHEPGFTLLATDGHFRDVNLSLEKDGKGVSVKETIHLEFKSIVLTYLKRVGKDNLPTNPFFYTAPDFPK